MSEKRFIQEFLDKTADIQLNSGEPYEKYPFITEKFADHENTETFYNLLETAKENAKNIKAETEYSPLEECIMYHCEMEFLSKSNFPKSILYFTIRQEYEKYKNHQISDFNYYLFLIESSLDNRIQAEEKFGNISYKIYEQLLCSNYLNDQKNSEYYIEHWKDSYNRTKQEADDERPKGRKNRTIKAQISKIDKIIEKHSDKITKLASNAAIVRSLHEYTKALLYEALKFIVREELYNLYPENDRSKQSKLVSLLNIFFHDYGFYHFDKVPKIQQPQEKIQYFKKDFNNSYIIQKMETDENENSIYLIGREILFTLDDKDLEHKAAKAIKRGQKNAKNSDGDILFDFCENILYCFVITEYAEEVPCQFYEIEKDKNKEAHFHAFLENMFIDTVYIVDDIENAYALLDMITVPEEEISQQIEVNKTKKKNNISKRKERKNGN